MRWLTVHVPSDPEREILLETPGPPAMDPATAEQVRDAAKKWLDKKRSVTGYLIKDSPVRDSAPKREEKRS